VKFTEWWVVFRSAISAIAKRRESTHSCLLDIAYITNGLKTKKRPVPVIQVRSLNGNYAARGEVQLQCGRQAGSGKYGVLDRKWLKILKITSISVGRAWVVGGKPAAIQG